MATTKLYGFKYSTCTQRVQFFLMELGVHFDFIDVNLKKDEHKSAAYLQHRHPFAKVPAFEDETTKVFESRAICRYMGAKCGMLCPSSAASPAEIGAFEECASVEYAYFDPNITNLAFQKLFKSMLGQGDPDEALVALYRQNVVECLDYYDRFLSTQDFLGGKDFSLIDIFHVPWFGLFPRLDLSEELSSRKHLSAWWDRVSNRESWKTIMSRLWG